MSRHAMLRRSLMMSGTILLLAACGPEQSTPPPAADADGQSTAAVIQYDPELHCLVSGPSISCGNGFTVYSYLDPVVGYFVRRNACVSSGGPLVCGNT
ncbi:hypothetical protein LZ198_40245 [Myxococcus sp. K15C18031901]|uniref:hypothetical protein n=1 Tax=Myxococcus dinghuensis TaxID=2906761 RepID=UPI0020A72496|nr:hypothetical protein [Myxococcus dinghuensis]MCP3105117.1 hypothetical protein [Myxococcus dinghuensis]